MLDEILRHIPWLKNIPLKKEMTRLYYEAHQNDKGWVDLTSFKGLDYAAAIKVLKLSKNDVHYSKCFAAVAKLDKKVQREFAERVQVITSRDDRYVLNNIEALAKMEALAKRPDGELIPLVFDIHDKYKEYNGTRRHQIMYVLHDYLNLRGHFIRASYTLGKDYVKDFLDSIESDERFGLMLGTILSWPAKNQNNVKHVIPQLQKCKSVLDFYEENYTIGHLYKAIDRNIADVSVVLEHLESDKVKGIVAQYSLHEHRNHAMRILSKYIGTKYVDNAIDLLKNYINEDLSFLVNGIEAAIDDKAAFEVFDKYKHIYPKISRHLTDNKGKCDLRGLLKENVLKATRDTNVAWKILDRILSKKYYEIKLQIDDSDVCEEISFTDMDIVSDTCKYLREIHAKREVDDYNKIIDGFFLEMNRAINQGRNLKQKLRYFKQYCFEVREQVKENVEELMYNA